MESRDLLSVISTVGRETNSEQLPSVNQVADAISRWWALKRQYVVFEYLLASDCWCGTYRRALTSTSRACCSLESSPTL